MLFEMPVVPQLVEKFPAFYATSGFITLFTTTHQQSPIASHFLPHHQHATFYTPLILLDMITQIKCVCIYIIKLLLCNFCILMLLPLRPKHLPKHPWPTSFTHVGDQASHRQTVVLFLYFWTANGNTKDSGPNGSKHFMNFIFL